MPVVDTELDCIRYTIASRVSRFIECECKVKLPNLPNEDFKNLFRRRAAQSIRAIAL